MTATYGVEIVWPNRRILPWSTVDVMYADAKANGDIDNSRFYGNLSLQKKAEALDDAGIITRK